MPVVAFLSGPVAEGGVDINGELAKGTLTNANFVPNTCQTTIGRPVNNIASLAFAMTEGLIYANTHSVLTQAVWSAARCSKTDGSASQ